MYDLTALQERLGYTFQNVQLLETAVTHGSYAVKYGTESFQRLEFLGDRIVNLICATWIYESNPTMREHGMTDLYQQKTSNAALAVVGDRIELYKYLNIWDVRPDTAHVAITASALEAVIAAVYLDSDLLEMAAIVMQNLGMR